jgi:hypothetical protein
MIQMLKLGAAHRFLRIRVRLRPAALKVGHEIALEGSSPEGYPIKWFFSEITSNSFSWHAEEEATAKAGL